MYHEELAAFNEPPPDPFLRLELNDRRDDQPNGITPLPTTEHWPLLHPEECAGRYEEVLSGVRCVRCGHFVGNWE